MIRNRAVNFFKIIEISFIVSSHISTFGRNINNYNYVDLNTSINQIEIFSVSFHCIILTFLRYTIMRNILYNEGL